ncbi:2-C-methyl-D-erythritol 4-phosphate cytidylyltransferase [Lutispora thermophila]|uniref:2-C-methyl-D-erythritol 4-phosphate cytidylyltransferase n=1 Tax=Lutispora thermophila DSM 19022 TaxID=1122184 RepID=A0A1M6BXU2_9FIRM|nr:2-C-methyl-D-erythritol 4-phosphate cytidylyltransferase [Lutispora thermophila]SHI53517.1 2-C-methyl-D-erythritol 4-phosphate cytidylyltransferase [Lutispora thermophila DSM 19022]
MNVAVILAGGHGTRMGIIDKPKQFIDVYGKPILIHTLEIFDANLDIDAIAVVCLDDWHEDLSIWLRKYELNKVKWIVRGGKTRQESVRNAIEVIKTSCNGDDIVIIHDAARPLVSNRIIKENIELAKKYGAVDTVIPTTDTIIRSKDGNKIFDVPVRRELYLGQTPQSFKYSIILEAHDKAVKDGILDATDDCQLVLNCNKDVYIVEGEKLNFKITTMDDLLLLKAIIKLGKIGEI